MLTLVCASCGKPCRSQVEVDLHRRRTGHTDFEDRTSDADVIQTEAEMKAAGSALEDYSAPAIPLAEGTTSGEADMVAPSVDVSLRQQLEDMGFSGNKATRALYFTGTSNLEQAVQWIMEHEEDPEAEMPLLVAKVRTGARTRHSRDSLLPMKALKPWYMW